MVLLMVLIQVLSFNKAIQHLLYFNHSCIFSVESTDGREKNAEEKIQERKKRMECEKKIREKNFGL